MLGIATLAHAQRAAGEPDLGWSPREFVILTNYSWLLASVEVSTVTMVKEQYREADVAKKM